MESHQKTLMGREVMVQREPLVGVGNCVIFYRYRDSVARWSGLSNGACRLLLYILLMELRDDGRFIFDGRAKVRTVEGLARSLDTIYTLLRELKQQEFIVQLSGNVYSIDKTFAEVATKKSRNLGR